MVTVQSVTALVDRLAPRHLAETWDNVGLLVGDPAAEVHRVMTCLTITPASASEAVRREANLIVTHHPLPFQPLKRLTAETITGRMLLDLIAAGVAVYSAHTAFDSAETGINQRLAEGIGLEQITPLVVNDAADSPELGSGRWGKPDQPLTLEELADRVKTFLGISGLHLVGGGDWRVNKVAVACGSGGEFLREARHIGCDALVTGEARFHTCLEAESSSIGLVMPGHFASERFALECLADYLSDEFPHTEIWASTAETDPIRWVR